MCDVNSLPGLILSMCSGDEALTDLEDSQSAKDTGAQGNKSGGTHRSSKVRHASAFPAHSVCRERKTTKLINFTALSVRK